MRQLSLVAALAALCAPLAACDGDGTAGVREGGTISPYYPDDAPHLSCTEDDGIPCCHPPVGPLNCPEGTVFEEEHFEGDAYLCRWPDRRTASSVSVRDGGVITHGASELGGTIEVCDEVTGKLEERYRRIAEVDRSLLTQDTHCSDYCNEAVRNCTKPACEDVAPR